MKSKNRDRQLSHHGLSVPGFVGTTSHEAGNGYGLRLKALSNIKTAEIYGCSSPEVEEVWIHPGAQYSTKFYQFLLVTDLFLLESCSILT